MYVTLDASIEDGAINAIGAWLTLLDTSDLSFSMTWSQASASVSVTILISPDDLDSFRTSLVTVAGYNGIDLQITSVDQCPDVQCAQSEECVPSTGECVAKPPATGETDVAVIAGASVGGLAVIGATIFLLRRRTGKPKEAVLVGEAVRRIIHGN